MPNSVTCTSFPKAIRRIKVAITTKCNIDCGYCFIHCPTSDMSWPVARDVVDFFVESAREEKLLSIYGGEPLLQYDLLKQMVLYARESESKNNQSITMECCTNSLLLNEEHLNFFKEYDVRLHVSLFGHQQDNDRYRAKGYRKVIENLSRASGVLGPMHTAACVCVTPQTVRTLRQDVEIIRKQTGTRVITLEPIIDFESWSMEDVSIFIEESRLIGLDMIASIKTDTPFFLKYVCWYLYMGGRRQKSQSAGYDFCPFEGSVDISPSGDMAFSPFTLYGKQDKNRGIIGNVAQRQGAWWQSCRFQRESSTCLNCYSRYFAIVQLSDKSKYLLSYNDALIDETVRKLQALALTDKRYEKYLEDAQLICQPQKVY